MPIKFNVVKSYKDAPKKKKKMKPKFTLQENIEMEERDNADRRRVEQLTKEIAELKGIKAKRAKAKKAPVNSLTGLTHTLLEIGSKEHGDFLTYKDNVRRAFHSQQSNHIIN